MFAKAQSAIVCLCISAGLNTARAEDLLFACMYQDGSHVKWTVRNNMIKFDDKEIKSMNIVITKNRISWIVSYDHVLMRAEVEIDRVTGATTWMTSFGAERTTSRTSGMCKKI